MNFYANIEWALAADDAMADLTEAHAITDSFSIKEKIAGKTGNEGKKDKNNVTIQISK